MSDKLRWKCHECGETFVSEPTRHDMDHCDCGETWVDHEEAYIRRSVGTECLGEPADLP
jgi:hypothetical protein